LTPGQPTRSPESDRDLLKRYHIGGDTGAREELVQRHLPLVRSLARRYAGRGESLEDIEQVGAIGLLKAIDRYDLEREVSLTTYATPNVVGEIERLTIKLERSPTIAEIAAELETTPEQVLEAMEAGSAYSTVSLSSGPGGGGDDDDFDPMESIGAEDEEYERTEQRASLEPALETLPEREREILRMRFEEGLTQTQIAEKIGISQMHVSRLIRKSLARMRDQLA
jgi:RNA polymerase sigma-B factor